MPIDIHAHSTYSDGTSTPPELMVEARDAGLGVVAITDHDTTAGWEQAAAQVGATGVSLVRGAEISCSTRELRISVHLLSYLHDPFDQGLLAEMNRARDSRVGRAREMVRLLSADFPITWDDLVANVGEGATIGRPHIADALISSGVVADRAEAFERMLHPRGPYFVRHYAPDPVDAVGLVRAAGGVPVFAHPGAITRGRIVSDDVIEQMAEAGLAGLEVNHRDNDDAARVRLRELAHRLGLFVTGSSDYHGDGKPNRLGENVTTEEVLKIIEEQGKVDVLRP